MKALGGHVLALVLLSVLLWAGSFIALKQVLALCDPNFVIFGRLSLAALCALPFYKQLGPFQYQKGDWRLLAGLGLFEPCLYFLLESKALMLTTAGQAGMITALMPAMVALAAWILLGEKISRQLIMGFALALLGVIVLTWSGKATETAPNPVLGNFLELLAMASATGYVLILKKLSPRYTPLALTTVQSLSGTLFFGILFGLSPVPVPWDLSAKGWGLIAFLGVGVSFGAYFCYNYAVARMPASQAAGFLNLTPVITLFLGWIFLGEILTPMQYGAAALTLAGVYLSQKRSRPPMETKCPPAPVQP
ncbi:MAG: DMT family transporter [Desulfobacterales bacterium]|nr:DMT family transporter [Desulfobacterales bacterium]